MQSNTLYGKRSSNLFRRRILIALIALIKFCFTGSCGAFGIATSNLLIKGNKLPCNDEGQIVTLPFLKNACITCVCQNSAVECFEDICPESHNCYFHYSTNSTNKCCTQCRGCALENGNYLRNGEQTQDRYDACHSYHCNSGTLTHFTTQCYVPCDKPISLVGQCCPSCNACPKSNTKDGEEIFDFIQDPCIRCYCFKGQLICSRRTCPVLPCPESNRFKPPNSCCPLCLGKRDAREADNKSCLIDGQTYREGDRFELNECTSCVCKNSTNICQKQTCPALNCDESKQVKLSGHCCANCASVSDGTADEMCFHKARQYRHMEWWQEACLNCTCLNGAVQCTAQACPNDFICPSGYQKVQLDGDCCPTCAQVDATCSMKDGLRKMSTYDRKRYHFDGHCNYVLTRDCVSKSFSVHVVRKYGKANDTNGKPIFEGTSLMVKIDNSKIYLSHFSRVRVNRSLVQLPFIAINQFSIARVQNGIKLRSSLGFEILWKANVSVDIKVRDHFRNRMCGLCGNFNFDAEDEFQLKNSKQISTLEKFAKSFQVGQNALCPKIKIPDQRVKSSWNEQIVARRICNRVQARNRDCINRRNNPHVYKRCIDDLVDCKDDRFCQCQAIERLRNQCLSPNPGPITKSVCKVNQPCPPGAEFKFCSYQCKKTCKNRARMQHCRRTKCRSGCNCIGKRVWHNGQCIPESSCIV